MPRSTTKKGTAGSSAAGSTAPAAGSKPATNPTTAPANLPAATGTASSPESSDEPVLITPSKQLLDYVAQGETDAPPGDDGEDAGPVKRDLIDRGTRKFEEKPPSPTALELGLWELRRGREMAKTADFLKREIDELEAADLHTALFEPDPVMAESVLPPVALRHQFLKQMFETTEYMELHNATQGDDFASEIAATRVGDNYVKLRKEVAERKKQNEQREANGQQPLPGAGTPTQGCNVFSAVANALNQAQQEVQEYQDACDAMGWGSGPGSPASKMDPNRITKMMQKVNKSARLKQILKWAGRFKIVAASCQREKTTVGYDEVVGVIPDNHLGRVLPQELVYLEDPALEVIFDKKFIERQIMCREFQAHEELGKGPIIVCIDESGSMGGSRIETAKGMMLAIGWIARKQKRWLTLAAFSDHSCCRIETFPTGVWDEAKMLAWIEAFYGGGTDLDGPLRQVPDYLDKLPGCPKGKIDMLLLTDGIVPCSPDLSASFLKWKQASKVRLLSIIIQSAPGVLADLSDEVYEVNALSLDSEATHAAFSI